MPTNSNGECRDAPETPIASAAIEEHVAGERVVARMQRRQPSGDATQILTSSSTAEHDLDHGAPIVVDWAVAGSHLCLSPSRPPELTMASVNVLEERHCDDALTATRMIVSGRTFRTPARERVRRVSAASGICPRAASGCPSASIARNDRHGRDE
jgi:hypothetical protein